MPHRKILALLGAAALLAWLAMPSPTSNTSAPVSAADGEEPKDEASRPARSADKRFPAALTPTGEGIPDELRERLKKALESSVRLSDGTRATMAQSRMSYPKGGAVELAVTVQDKTGKPLTGRADLRFVAYQTKVAGEPLGPEGGSMNVTYLEDARQPGKYNAVFDIPSTWKSFNVTSSLTRSGDVNEPGEVGTMRTAGAVSTAATLAAPPRFTVTAEGVTMFVSVVTSEATTGIVRATLRAEDYAWTMDAVSAATPLQPVGVSVIELRFARQVDVPSVIEDLVFFIGDPPALADYDNRARVVR